ncbi:MAG: DUF1343 domain-containing protein [Bacteroidales bacterium]|nr:DUF1343 domain-containing protein [Bacteroidales bacterium]
MALTCCCGSSSVILGDEQFDQYLPLLEGQRVAVYSNHTGIVGDRSTGLKVPAGSVVTEENSLVPFGTPAEEGGTVTYGPHLVDVLIEKGVDVAAIFSPEHGFRGNADAGEHVPGGVDEVTGVPILSLYEKGLDHPGEEAMSKFDVIVVDIQDVGLRYYTYYVTMQHLMDAAAIYGKKVIILDRPNPNGFYIDGPILDMQYKSGIGSLPIAMVHGMTLGELALMINGEGWLEEGRKCDLTVIPCRNYTHAVKYSLLLPPSPNLKDMKSIYLYSSTCFFACTPVTEGRGTPWPFEIYGCPDMHCRDFSFTPRSIPGAKSPRYMDEVCYGRDLRSVPLETIWERGIDLEYLIDAYNDLNLGPDFFHGRNGMEIHIGRRYVRDMIIEGCPADSIKARWAEDVETFKRQRAPYLLYPEE